MFGVSGSKLENGSVTFRGKQLDEIRMLSDYPTGEACFDLVVLKAERLQQHFGSLFVKTGGAECTRKLVVECRKVSILSCKPEGAFSINRSLVVYQCAGESDLRPGVARFQLHCLAAHFEGPLSFVVSCKPIGGAGN